MAQTNDRRSGGPEKPGEELAAEIRETAREHGLDLPEGASLQEMAELLGPGARIKPELEEILARVLGAISLFDREIS